jgi:hypothetical protein
VLFKVSDLALVLWRVPTNRDEIEIERLLDSISLVLVGQNYRPSGGPVGVRSEQLMINRELGSTQVRPIPIPSDRPRCRLIQCASDPAIGRTRHPKCSPWLSQPWGLSILAVMSRACTDDLPILNRCCLLVVIGHVLSEFARQRALPYLENDHPEVRQAAALTCCRIYARDPICHQASAHAIEVMSEVLDKLLVVGIADPGMLLVPNITCREQLTRSFMRCLHSQNRALESRGAFRSASGTGRKCPLSLHRAERRGIPESRTRY